MFPLRRKLLGNYTNRKYFKEVKCMKKQRDSKSRMKFHWSIMLLLAVAVSISSMSGTALAAVGDIYVDDGAGVPHHHLLI